MRNLPRWTALVLGLALCAFYLMAETYTLDGALGMPLDDSWIHLQFARNLADGNGLSINPGELVTGSTAPLWTALLALLFLLPGSPVLWTKLLGVALYLVTGWLVFRVGRELGLSTGLALLALVLTLGTDRLVWSALSGLEIPLFTALALWGVLHHLRERTAPERPPVSQALLAIAALARPEGLLLLGLAMLDRWLGFRRDSEGGLVAEVGGWRALLIPLGIAAIVLLPMTLFNLAVGDSALPTTFDAKASPSQSGGARLALPELRYLFQAPIAILFASQPYMVLFAAAGVLALLARLGGARDRGWLLAGWIIALPLAYGSLSAASGEMIAGNLGRYYFPLFPFVILVGCVGLDEAAGRVGSVLTVGRARLPLRALVAILILWPTVVGAVRGSQRYAQNVANVSDSDVAASRWVADRIPAEATLAVNDIGAFSYLLPNRILDLAGIAHPKARRYRFEAVAAGRPPAEGTLRFLEENRPDYLVVFPEWFPTLVGGARDGTAPGYRLLQSFPIPDNVTMGGSEVVVLSTPWTRYPLK